MSRLRLAAADGAMELVIFLGAWALVAVCAVIGGADSRPRIDRSRDWGLRPWKPGD